MLLRSVRITNFRGLRNVEIQLDETTVFVGENNVGKTSVLEAIRVTLTRALARRGVSPYEEEEYYLATAAATPRDAAPIEIELHFSESTSGEWPKDLTQRLNDIIVFSDDDRRHVILKVKSGYDPTIEDFTVEWGFVDVDGTALPQKSNSFPNLSALLASSPVHYLNAFRSARDEFTARGQYFRAYVRQPGLPSEVQAELETKLREINKTVIDAHATLGDLRTNLARVQSIVALGSAKEVNVEPVPGRVGDLLARTEVNITAVTGAVLPMARHGAGTQSLSVLFLFDSYIRTFQKLAPGASPLLLLEEPEAHLHPNAIRASWAAIDALPGQKLVATHSGDLLSRVPLESVRRLYRRGDEVHVGTLATTLSIEERAKIDFHLRASRGELLFARVWLLVEGESEFWIYHEAASILGIDLDQLGVRIVNYGWSGPEPLLKVANDFGILWLVAPDGDQSGTATVAKATEHLRGDAPDRRIHQLSEPDLELLLAAAGYGSVYEAHVSPQKANIITAPQGTSEYWKQVRAARDGTKKPMLALEVTPLMRACGAAGVPSDITKVLDKLRVLANQ